MRKRNTGRVLGTATLTLVVLAVFVAMAVPALAHHPEIEASSRCSEDGLPYIDFVSTSWDEHPVRGTNPNIGIYVNDVWQTSGAYVEGSYQFSGSIEASAWEGQTVVVKARADAPWGNGTAPGDFRETTVTVPTDCAPDTVSVGVNVGACRYDDNLSLTTVTVSIDPESGATVTILKGEDVVGVFTGTGGEVVLEPGDYMWKAQASQGFELIGVATDQFTTIACPPPPPPPPPPPALGAIGDLVWLDANGDGYQGDFEAGVAGVTVNLLNSGGSVIATTATDSSGNYLFTGLAGGTYEVQFVLPAGFEVSPLRAAAVALDSDAGVAGRTGAITLPSGVTDLTWDAGIFETPKVLPQVITTTTPTTPPETLPFTGVTGGGAGGVAVALLALGSLVLLVVGRREEETESRAYGGRDS